MDFDTANLYLIRLSDHNDNFSKCNQKIVTDHSFKRQFFLLLLSVNLWTKRNVNVLINQVSSSIFSVQDLQLKKINVGLEVCVKPDVY